jgi:hypothetical protein
VIGREDRDRNPIDRGTLCALQPRQPHRQVLERAQGPARFGQARLTGECLHAALAARLGDIRWQDSLAPHRVDPWIDAHQGVGMTGQWG